MLLVWIQSTCTAGVGHTELNTFNLKVSHNTLSNKKHYLSFGIIKCTVVLYGNPLFSLLFGIIYLHFVSYVYAHITTVGQHIINKFVIPRN